MMSKGGIKVVKIMVGMSLRGNKREYELKMFKVSSLVKLPSAKTIGELCISSYVTFHMHYLSTI